VALHRRAGRPRLRARRGDRGAGGAAPAGEGEPGGSGRRGGGDRSLVGGGVGDLPGGRPGAARVAERRVGGGGGAGGGGLAGGGAELVAPQRLDLVTPPGRH